MRKKWTNEEINLFIEIYPIEKMEELIKIFNRSESSLVTKANKLGIKREVKSDGSRYYSEYEKEYIINNAKNKTLSQIAKELNRSIVSLKSMADRLNVVSGFWWTDEEIKFLIENFETEDKDYICKTLNKEWKAIGKKARSLGLNRTKKNGEKYIASHPSNKTEDEFILNNFERMTSSEMARVLNRSVFFVENRCGYLNVFPYKKRKNPNEFTNDDLINFIILFYDEKGYPPSIEDIQKDPLTPSIDTYYDRFGSYLNALIMSGIDLYSDSSFGRRCVSKSGEFCFSIPEKEITDFLFDNNIRYRKEVLYSELSNKIFSKHRADWVLFDDTVVEYFGLENKIKYNEKTRYKIELCKENSITIISIYKKDLSSLEKIFKKYM